MNAKSVLVTGANGFVGQHVCRMLIDSGWYVTACVRQGASLSGLGESSGTLKVARLSSAGVEGEYSRAFSGVETVIHLAGRAHVMHETEREPLQVFRSVNVAGTESCALAAASAGVKRFILVSSTKVNGEFTAGAPFSADDPPGFCDPYGQSKWEAEERLREVATATGMEWVVVRPPLIYGPGVRANFLKLFDLVFRRIPMPLGGLHNRRALVSVFNLSDFLVSILEHPAAANNRFIVADQNDISTPDLIRCIGNALHRPARLISCPESVLRGVARMLGQRAAIQRLCSSLTVDRQKTKVLIGWDAPRSVNWELERTANWFLKGKSAL